MNKNVTSKIVYALVALALLACCFTAGLYVGNYRKDTAQVQPSPTAAVAVPPTGQSVIVVPTPSATVKPESIEPTPEPEESAVVITPTPSLQSGWGLPTNYTSGTYDTVLAEDIFILTNQEREKNGIPKLNYNSALQEAADTRAYECSIRFSHTRPDGSSCHDIVDGFDYYVTGENLIKADRALATGYHMMGEWMLSEGHRANILLPNFTDIAVGVYESDGVVYACQIFIG